MEQTLDPIDTNPNGARTLADDEDTRAANLSRAERWVSMAGGSVLTLWGVSQLELGGALTAGVGTYLLYRGATGHCPLYRRLGISSLEPTAMELSADARATIGRAADVVYAWMRRPENLSRPMKYLKRVVEENDRLWRFIAELPGGKRVEWRADLTEERPGESLHWSPVSGVLFDGTLRVDSIYDGAATEVRVIASWIPARAQVRGLFSKAFELVGSLALSALVKSELDRVKAYLEDEQADAGEDVSPRPLH